jgi:predicted nucleotidyltransferase
LFGSVARGAAREGGDVDIAVLFELEPPRTLEGIGVDLAYDLQEVLGREVDLVVLNHASADLAHRVMRDGILVSERNRSARIRFEVRARNEYFDLEPILRRYRRVG